MLLFERLGTEEAYRALVRAVNANEEGKPSFLEEWEEKAASGEDFTLESPWDDPFIREWLALPPEVGGRDLRGALYVSREHTPLITPEDRLSSASAGLLAALLESPDMASALKESLGEVAPTELAVIMDRLLERARQVQQWGVPPILDACLVVAEVDQSQGKRLAAFLADRPHNQIEPNIVPKVAEHAWSENLFRGWESGSVSEPVKAAIKRRRENGDVAK
jgi:predicted KAP-like P-loop ATPase